MQLKLQIHSLHGIKALHWQGDTRALSLTPPVDASSPDGWSIIMPVWNSEPGAANRWRLSVVVEDKQGQRVSSNEDRHGVDRAAGQVYHAGRLTDGLALEDSLWWTHTAASTRDLSFIFFSMCFTCTLTVLSVISVRRAIILFGSPRLSA